jgi:peptidoglycan/xylan/chitin deacetylase (PgdA/CDA1 family)
MYHSVVGATPASLSKHVYVTAEEFRGQMRALKRRSYTPVTFTQLHAAHTGGAALPGKPVVLTFDDGYDGLFDGAHPVLTEMGFPYTVFLVSSLVGKSNEWDQAIGYPELKLLSWQKIRQMQAGGLATFEAHTSTHPHLDRLSVRDCRREVAQCKDDLEQGLGRRLSVFCYPYGDFNEKVEEIVAECGFECAVTTSFGRVRASDSLLRLPRISIYHVPPISITYGIGSLNFWWRVESNEDKRPFV